MQKQYNRLTLSMREEISKGLWAKESFSKIAIRISTNSSTVSREVNRNVKRKTWYSAVLSHKRARKRNKNRGRKKKLDINKELLFYVCEKLKIEWSPEEIANRLVIDYPNSKSMRISHESIYQYLYCLPRGELKKELMKGLRQGRKKRQPGKYAHYRKGGVKDILSISERPKEVEDRIVPGHWEGDLIIGEKIRSALGTLVERTTRFILLVPLTKKDAFSVRIAFAKAFARIPKQYKKTMTYDRGVEMAQHKLFTKDTKIQVFFADPYSPWQRGTNENTNGLIRQYFPKGTDFSKVSISEIRKVEGRLNSRPRKVLGFYTPYEKFRELVIGKDCALET